MGPESKRWPFIADIGFLGQNQARSGDNLRLRAGRHYTIDSRMSRCLHLSIIFSFFVVPHMTAAQESIENPMVIEDSGQAYLNTIRLSRIDADVAYFDPQSPPPPLQTQQDPRPPSDPGQWSLKGDVNVETLLVSAAVLMVIIYIFGRLGSGFAVTFAHKSENTESGREARAQRQGLTTPRRPGNLNAILHIRDRREALIQLAQAALGAAIAANGMLPQRSWTARDALRHLPDDQSCLAALRNLVLASERVHFGGRDINEDDFQAHVAGIRPLLTEAPE